MSDCMTTSLPTVRGSVPWTKLPDGAVLFSPDTEVYYAMNSVAAVIWELLAENTPTIDELCAKVGQRFPDACQAHIRVDVTELLAELVSLGLADPPAGVSAA
jgi:hypothetical protein